MTKKNYTPFSQHHKRTPEDATEPGKKIPEDSIVCCDMCGTPLCEECGTTDYIQTVPNSRNQK